MTRLFSPLLVALLLHTATSVTQNDVKFKSEEEKEKFMKYLNDARRKAANKLDIPYMYELIYDETLYQQYDLFNVDYIPSWEFRAIEETHTYHEMFLSEAKHWRDEDIWDGRSENRVTTMSPLQKRVRCLKMEDGVTKCFLGPIKEQAWWYYSNGPAGSRCDDGYYNNLGLCSRIPITTTSTTTITTTAANTTKILTTTTEEDVEYEDCICSAYFSKLRPFLISLILIAFYLF